MDRTLRSGQLSDSDAAALALMGHIELAAVQGWTAAALLPFVTALDNAATRAFVSRCLQEHQGALAAVETMAGMSSGPVPDAVTSELGVASMPTTFVELVSWETTLEQRVIATASQLAVGSGPTPAVRVLFGRLAAAAAGRLATARLITTLGTKFAGLLNVPTDIARLPDAVGSASYPQAFASTDNALQMPK